MMLKAITVTGDSGEDYEVTVNPETGRAHCTCKAYRFAYVESCKHIEYLDRMLNLGLAPTS